MGFNHKKFERASFKPRTREVEVEALAAFFGDGARVWTVRNLTGEELGQVNEAADQAAGMVKIIDAIASGEQGDVVKQLLGLAGDVPADLAKRIAALRIGSVNPQIDQQTAVKIFANYPTQAFELSNAVFALTGLGAEPGK